MTEFNKKQIELLRGSFPRIADRVGCTQRYVSKVVNGHVESDTELTREIKKIASQILEILQPSECIEV